MKKKSLISKSIQKLGNLGKRYNKEGATIKLQRASSKAVRNLRSAVSKSNLARKRMKRASK